MPSLRSLGNICCSRVGLVRIFPRPSTQFASSSSRVSQHNERETLRFPQKHKRTNCCLRQPNPIVALSSSNHGYFDSPPVDEYGVKGNRQPTSPDVLNLLTTSFSSTLPRRVNRSENKPTATFAPRVRTAHHHSSSTHFQRVSRSETTTIFSQRAGCSFLHRRTFVFRLACKEMS